nr:MAG TPA_asm: hypothetical protein [Bacteriophage sp.]
MKKVTMLVVICICIKCTIISERIIEYLMK